MTTRVRRSARSRESWFISRSRYRFRYLVSTSVRPWNVSGSGLRFLAEKGQLVDSDRGLAPPRLRRRPDDSDDVAEAHLDVADPARVADELDPSGAIDEVEEYELSHLAPRHDPTREAPFAPSLAAGFHRLCLGADGRDVVPVGKALRRRHRRPAYPPVPPSSWNRFHDDRPTWSLIVKGVLSRTTQRTQERFLVRRAVMTSPCRRPSYRARLTRQARIVSEAPSSTAM